MEKKNYVSDDEKLMCQWDWKANSAAGYSPEAITTGSTKKVFWKCEKGHVWQASPNNRSKGQGCPICAGRQVLAGYNDLLTCNPDIAAEWHPKKNKPLTPQTVTAHSSKAIWWKCAQCGHEWKTSVSNRSAGKGCPVCSLKRQGQTKVSNLIKVSGSFADKYPELLAEWDYDKNVMSPSTITPNSSTKVWWKCSVCGYTWRTSVSHRTIRRSGCPACKNKVATNINSVKSVRPDLLNYWDYEKNIDITPADVTPGSNKKVWWKCALGHEWMAPVTSIANGGQCPICCGQRVLEGYNDLLTKNPELAKEWHPTKNGTLLPSQVTTGSSKIKVWWLCPKGHEYQATVANRNNGTGCPICDKEQKTSFPEQAIFFYLGKHTPAVSRYLLDGKTEIDIYLPELRVGIEYDGYFFHNNAESRKKELKKDEIIHDTGITLLRVKEYKDHLPPIEAENVIFCKYTASYSYLEEVLIALSDKIYCLTGQRLPVDFNIARDSAAIYAQYIESEKENSLAARNPVLAKEWHPEKNGYLTPDKISFSSAKVVWWLGKCGHEWRSSVDNRRRGNGCPICSGHQLLTGYNDLATTHPQLCQEWHPTKNGDLTPQKITKGSHKKVWWICPKGHEYSATVSNRVFGRGCPICSPEKRSAARNRNRILRQGSLAQTHPDLAAEWNYELNGDLRPDDVTKGASRKVWWTCPKGHTYQSTIANRVSGRKCPVCAGKKIIDGVNDLATLNPSLAQEWDYERNQNLTPNQISPNSHKKVWWICKNGHEWEAQVKSRNYGCGCPMCAKGRKKQE